MKILFVDASPTMLAKNLLPLARALKNEYKLFEAIFVSLNISSYVDHKIEKKSIQQLLSDNLFSYFSINKSKQVSSFLYKHKPNLIFIGGYRIFDMLWIAVGKENNIPTYKLQHGFDTENLHYNPQIIISKFRKVIKMARMVLILSKILDKNFYRMIIQYFQYFSSGKSLNNSLFNDERLQPNKMFVFSNYYKDYWFKIFGLPKQIMEIISPPDFLLIPKIQLTPRINACCYLTQTLVEDGRMRKKEFDNIIIKQYINIANNVDHFIIKLHPRSNKSLYDDLVALPNVSIVRDFPNCSVYLTHYSSMAYTAFMFSNSVILHELPGHSTPDLFKPVASLISSDIKRITEKIQQSINNPQPNFNSQKNKINYYASVEVISPIDKIREVVISNFKN